MDPIQAASVPNCLDGPRGCQVHWAFYQGASEPGISTVGALLVMAVRCSLGPQPFVDPWLVVKLHPECPVSGCWLACGSAGEVEVRGGGSLEDYWWRPLTAENTLVEAPLPVGLPSPAQGALGDGQHHQDAPSILTLSVHNHRGATMVVPWHHHY